VRHKSMALLAALAMALTLVPAVAGQDEGLELGPAKDVERGEFNSYIVIMQADPLVVTEGTNLDTARARNRGQQLRQSHRQALAAADVNADRILNQYVAVLNGFSARMNFRQAVEVSKSPGVAMVLPDELRQPTTDSSPRFLGLDSAGGPYMTGYDGAGVVVGVIDTGIWPEHPSFAGAGFPAPPTGPLPCDFGNTAHNPDDAPFACNNKLIGARQMLETYRALIGADPDEFDSARDDNGHGTHTASTAAGNSGVSAEVLGIARGTISGIAPRAHVIAYKGLGNLGGFTSDLAAAIDQAVLDGVHVINYSIGGGASLTGADEIAFLFAADAGVFVATSAGNSGPGAATVGGPGTVPWLTTVGANTQSRFFQGTVELGNGATYTGASITAGVDWAPLVDAADAGGDLCVPGTLDPADVEGAIVLCRRGTIARVAKSLAVMDAGGVGMVMYENSDAGNLFSDTHWVPSVHVDNTPGLAMKAYIGSAAEPTARLIGEQLSTWPNAPTMTDFSSRGPNPVAPDIIKPDITAPGIQILAGGSPFPDAGSVPGELFQAIAGTSMSSPHVAGVFALIKQAQPGWSPAMARSAIMTSAHQNVLDNDRTSAANPFARGAGHLDPGNKVDKGSAFQPGLVYDAGLLEYLGFLCDAAPEVFANPAATCAALAGLGIPTDAVNLNLPSIGIARLAGSQTVRRMVTSVAKESGNRTYRVSVDAPAGYSVSVNPSTLTLRRGQSATYEVTIVNNSAPLDTWRFGSLTWRETSGGYDVYSPIAVRAVEFSAPAEVTGSGESGSASFDVKFGYSGDYEAAAHGLEPAVLTVDNVLQDANQSFAPGDVATGGANAHTFDLADAAFFRVAIPPEATEAGADLDVFVYNPSNQLVASSTLGGTNEVVDISFPADGTWTVYVHGWLTPGGDSDYTMYSWVIAEAAGGNLSIDNAPASATIGDTGTVEVSWSGATAGEWHLGAVSHTRNSLGDLGLTLVNVDNR
jgi:subtilisin family serine protease